MFATAFADTYCAFLFPPYTVQQVQLMHADRLAIQQISQQNMQLAHHLLSDKFIKSGATPVNSNPFQTTLNPQPYHDLPCRLLAETANVQISSAELHVDFRYWILGMRQ